MHSGLSDKILLLPYFIMIVIGLTLPSVAYHGILNPKSLIFFSATGCMLLYIAIRGQFKISQLNILLFLLSSCAFLLFWLLLGNMETLSIRIDQLKLFLITIAIPAMTLYLLREDKITRQAVFKTVIYSNLAYCTLKLSAVILHLLGIINIWEVLEVFGFRVMKMSIFGVLQRLQSSLDISTPFILLFVLQSEYLGIRLTRRMKIFYIVVSLFSIFLAFSRFLWFVYAISFILYLMTLPLSRIAKSITIGGITLAACIGIVGTDYLTTSIQQRFFSKANYYSDQERVKQFQALIAEHDEAPFLGKGLGSFSPELIRDKQIKHSYELQWVAFLMQFGLLGVILMLIPLAIIVFRFFQYPLTRVSTGFLSLFILWILSGLTNPYLISLQSGIIYTIFLIFPENGDMD
jgi:hypothetical protein